MNEYLKSITNAVNYIETHLTEPIKVTGFSTFHLHRIFKSITGKPIMKYVRARKLSSSTRQLLNSKMSLLDIAVEYGFEHQQSYTRAFEHTFGIPPSFLRKNGTTIPLEPVIDLEKLHAIEEGILVSPKYIAKTQFYVTGILSRVNHQENYAHGIANKLAIDFLDNYKIKVPNAINKNVYIGLIAEDYENGESALYIPSVEVSGISGDRLQEMVTAVVPSRRYAVFKYIGRHSSYLITYQLLADLYDYIFSKFIWESGDKKSDSYHFERIDFDLCGDDYCEMEINIPVSDGYPVDRIIIKGQ